MAGRGTAGAAARSARPVEWEACRELARRSGLDPELFDILTRTDPEHRPEYLRIVDLGGRPVSLTLVVPRRVLIAGVPVEGAVLTMAGTDPGFRGRGLGRLLLEDTMAFLRGRGFRVGLACGPPELLRRFGFVPALGTYTTTFDPGAVKPIRSGIDSRGRFWRPATSGDAPALSRLFVLATTGTPCTVLRPPQAWLWRCRSAGSGLSVYVEEGEVRGYVRWSSGSAGLPGGTYEVSEVGAESRLTLADSLEWVAERAIELGRTSVRFVGPPDHPFSRQAYLRAAAEVTVGPTSASQVIVANRGLLMADIAVALGERAAAAGLGSGTRLTLDVGAKRFDLSFAGGRLRVLGGRAGGRADAPVSRLPVEAFTALVTGYAGGGEIDALPGVSLADEHRETLQALFPRAYPNWIPAPYWRAARPQDGP